LKRTLTFQIRKIKRKRYFSDISYELNTIFKNVTVLTTVPVRRTGVVTRKKFTLRMRFWQIDTRQHAILTSQFIFFLCSMQIRTNVNCAQRREKIVNVSRYFSGINYFYEVNCIQQKYYFCDSHLALARGHYEEATIAVLQKWFLGLLEIK